MSTQSVWTAFYVYIYTSETHVVLIINDCSFTVYIYIYICFTVYIYICMYIIYILCVYILCINIYIYILYIYIHVYIYIIYIYTYIYTHVYYVYIYIHIHMYTYIYVISNQYMAFISNIYVFMISFRRLLRQVHPASCLLAKRRPGNSVEFCG